MKDTAQSRYEMLKRKRDPFLTRARECAELTIPALMPPDGHNEFAMLPQPYSGLGARCVVSLASRLMVAMYPPGKPSFRLTVPSDVLLQQGQMKADTQIEQGLTLSETLINGEIERKGWRQPTNLALQYLIVTGNALEFLTPDNRIRTFRLDQYVVCRDATGAVKEIIIEDGLSPESLPENLKELVTADDYSSNRVKIYTHVKRNKEGKFDTYQELNQEKISGSQGTYDVLPYNVLRYTAVIGEDYGRGKVEEHLPDFRALDGLAKAMLDGAAMASRHVNLVRPNAAGGQSLRKRLAEANNGDYIVGNVEDVSMLQFQNTTGMQVTAQELDRMSREVASAFLLNSGAVRDSERTTATEIRQMQEELESVLGGVYSQLNQEMQMARLKRLIVQMQRDSKLPEWPEGMVEPTILTGLEALGREQDVNRVQAALQFLQGMPPEVLMYVKFDELLGKAFYGLNLPDAVRSEEEVQMMQQQQMMQQAMAAGGQAAAVGLAEQAVQQ
jgi:hypothetical protein